MLARIPDDVIDPALLRRGRGPGNAWTKQDALDSVIRASEKLSKELLVAKPKPLSFASRKKGSEMITSDMKVPVGPKDDEVVKIKFGTPAYAVLLALYDRFINHTHVLSLDDLKQCAESYNRLGQSWNFGKLWKTEGLLWRDSYIPEKYRIKKGSKRVRADASETYTLTEKGIQAGAFLRAYHPELLAMWAEHSSGRNGGAAGPDDGDTDEEDEDPTVSPAGIAGRPVHSSDIFRTGKWNTPVLDSELPMLWSKEPLPTTTSRGAPSTSAGITNVASPPAINSLKSLSSFAASDGEQQLQAAIEQSLKESTSRPKREKSVSILGSNAVDLTSGPDLVRLKSIEVIECHTHQRTKRKRVEDSAAIIIE